MAHSRKPDYGDRLLGAPARLIPDIVGLLTILYILFKARRQGLVRFIRTGMLA